MLRAGEDAGELGSDASELVSESRVTERLDWLFLFLSDLRLGEYRRVLKTLSQVEGFAPCSEKLAGMSSHLGVPDDLLRIFRTWSKMGSRVCRVLCGPWSGICCVSLIVYLGALTAPGEREGEGSMTGTDQGASSPMVYEMPLTTPARGALFCRETVLVVDMLAGGCLELLFMPARREACSVRRDVALFRVRADAVQICRDSLA